MGRSRTIKDKEATQELSLNHGEVNTDFEDQYEDEEKEILRTRGSIQDAKEKLKEFSPRSRTLEEREFTDRRVDTYIDYYQRLHTQQHRGKTYVDSKNVPEGYAFMWAAETCRGRPQPLRDLEHIHGWKYATPADMPEYAVYDDYGNIDDSINRVRVGACIGMIREKAIHNAQLEFLSRQRNLNDKMKERMRNKDNNVPHPFSTRESDRSNEFFPSNDMANSFARSF
jgi:hypothetical protein